MLALLLLLPVLGRVPVSCNWTSAPVVTTVRASDRNVYVEWSAADTNVYEVTEYEACLQTPAEKWQQDSRFYLYPTDSSVQPLAEALADVSNWKACVPISLGRGRSYTLSGLTSTSVYRVAIRAYADPCSVSEYSQWQVFITTGVQRYVLEAEGTGSNNHLPARILLNGQVLLQRDNFRGLYLHVLSRFSLATVFSGVYDTQNSAATSDELAAKLLTFDASVVVVVVSCSVWEGSVTQALVQALQTYGAKLIAEVMNSDFRYQPYLFLGIRDLGQVAGQSIESLRASRGLYLYNPRDQVKVPTARGRLVLRKNAYRRFYFIEAASQWQYDSADRYYMGSLRYLIPDIREANMTLETYLGFVIKADYADVYAAGRKETELDILWASGPIARYDFKHQLYSSGADLQSLPQTPVIQALLAGDPCEPPYSTSACSQLPTPPLILQCGVGISPYNCGYLGLPQVESSSSGFT